MSSTLKEKLRADLTRHFKNRDELETTTLRSVVGAIQNGEKSGKVAVDFSDSQVKEILRRETNRRRESSLEYANVGAADRSAREAAEADFLATYLPKPLTEAELQDIVKQVIASTVPAAKNFGIIMKKVVAEVDGRADGKTVAALVKGLL